MGQPYKKSVVLKEPPVCSRCSGSPGSIDKLEQHADVLKKPKEQARPPKRILEGSSGHLSLEQPLRKEANFVTNDPLKGTTASRSLPAWMSLLPSQKNAEIHPPKHSVLQRRSTFPYLETTRMSTPDDSPVRTPSIETATERHAEQNTPTVVSNMQTPREKSRPRRKSSLVRPQSSSSNLSFVSFEKNQREASNNHMNYFSRRSHCPSAYVVHPSSNFSRPRAPSSAKSAPSVIDVPQKEEKRKRVRRRLSKQLSARNTDEATAVPKVPEKQRRKSRPWKLDWSRSSSPEEDLEECMKANHTPEPSQDIGPAKPPFFKELSGFLASRAGKWILPSRISERRSQKSGNHTDTSSCEQCGHGALSGNVCERCQSRVDIPGGFV